MPGSVTAPASLLLRLPTDKVAYFAPLLSRNANAPGAAVKQSTRAVRRDFAKRAGELGIFLIESRVTGPLAASVGGVNPPSGAVVTLDTTAGTPATVDIDTSELEAVTWAGAGTKIISVVTPAGLGGSAKVVV